MSYASKVWVSHSSISDFLNCPRSYYLKNIYKDDKTGNKIQIASPALSLGQIVHEVIESLAVIRAEKRFEIPLIKRFDDAWPKVSGQNGGFESINQENEYRERGEKMLERLRLNPNILKKPAVKINMELPNFPLTEEGDLILCGKIDWLEYIPETNSVNIIDFKTSLESREDPESLQLPIYHLLTKNCQKYEVAGAYYWYLEQNDTPTQKVLPKYEDSFEKILYIARKIKLARQLESFQCPQGNGCKYCSSYEKVKDGQAIYLFSDQNMHKDVYLLKGTTQDREGAIL